MEFSVLKLPSGQNKPLPYLVTLFPPLVLALLDPEIFFKALDFAGTYGGISLPTIVFGVKFKKCAYFSDSFFFHFKYKYKNKTGPVI